MSSDLRFVRRTVERRVEHYQALRGDAPITFAEALSLWQDDTAFTDQFCRALLGSSFSNYCLEAPPVHRDNVARAFEFVLVDAPDLSRAPDRLSFASYFDARGPDDGVFAFSSLGADARLIVPSPRTEDDDFAYPSRFVKSGWLPHVRALWRVVAVELGQVIGAEPVWLSTSGGGVAWLHVRLDSRPKYYRYRPYRQDG